MLRKALSIKEIMIFLTKTTSLSNGQINPVYNNHFVIIIY